MGNFFHSRPAILGLILFSALFVPCFFTAGAVAQAVPPEFAVNQYTNNAQTETDLAMDTQGNFVVVWTSEWQDGSGLGVYARLYDQNGNPSTDEFLVNGRTSDDQSAPAAAMSPAGTFVVVWQSSFMVNQGEILGRLFNSDGTPYGDEFFVNTSFQNDQTKPAVAMDGAGNFVVVWASDQSGPNTLIYGQRFNATGQKQGPEFPVNTTPNNSHDSPAVAMNYSGQFVVSWEADYQDGDGLGVFARNYTSSGDPDGDEYQVNETTAGDQSLPAVAMSESSWVIAWQTEASGNSRNVSARLFSYNGPTRAEFTANSMLGRNQDTPDVSMTSDGFFLISWESLRSGDNDIYARLFDAAGNPQDVEFLVNLYQQDEQKAPAAALRPDYAFVIAWQSADQDGDNYGIFGRLFNCLVLSDCNDGDFCNGMETCQSFLCVAGQPVTCVDDGQFCDGQETCRPSDGLCISPGDPCGPNESCDEWEDSCVPLTDDDVDDDIDDDTAPDDDTASDDDTAGDDTIGDDDTAADDDIWPSDDEAGDDTGFLGDDSSADDDAALEIGNGNPKLSNSSGCGC